MSKIIFCVCLKFSILQDLISKIYMWFLKQTLHYFHLHFFKINFPFIFQEKMIIEMKKGSEGSSDHELQQTGGGGTNGLLKEVNIIIFVNLFVHL